MLHVGNQSGLKASLRYSLSRFFGFPLKRMLRLDRREVDLIRLLADTKPDVRELPMGDLLCEYENPDVNWIGERKTAIDLAASIVDGRLFEQTARIHEAGYRQIFWFVEGDLRLHSVPHQSMLGACVNMALREHSVLIRTQCVEETAAIVRQLISKVPDRPGIPSGAAPAAPLTKRKRDQNVQLIYLRMLQCIPTVSERVARKLIQHFDSLPALQHALGDLSTFPEIRLDDRQCLGKSRLKALKSYLCQAEEDVEIPNSQIQCCVHVPKKCFPDGPRDNGEFYWKCALCDAAL